MNIIWLDEAPMYGCNKFQNQSEELIIPNIMKWRRTEFVDYDKIDKLKRMKTYDLFGNSNPAKVSENSCLSLVQINDINEIVSNISLCDYPNIPSVPFNGWIEWISRHYGIHGVTQRNTLFIHMLIWDIRYNDLFYKKLLDAVFISNIQTDNIILIVPPFVTPVGFVEEHMTRIVPNGEDDTYRIQALYISLRHMHCPRLKIRRLVEEDNDDVVPILDRESERFKELYGEFYISEMMRYPDGIRQMVVAEADGVATGILCINKNVDLLSLNQHFELAPYNGLKKQHRPSYANDDNISEENINLLFPSNILFQDVEEIQDKQRFRMKPAIRSMQKIINDFSAEESDKTELPKCSCSDDGEFCNKFYSKAPCPSCGKIFDNNSELKIYSNTVISRDDNLYGDDIQSLKYVERKSVGNSSKISSVENRLDKDSESIPEMKINEFNDRESNPTRVLENSNIVDRETFYEKDVNPVNENQSNKNDIGTGIKIDMEDVDDSSEAEEYSKTHLSTINDSENLLAIEDVAVEINPRKIIHKDIKIPIFEGETNAFTLELFSIREDIDERFSYDYLEAVFECFPEEDYCVVLIPPSYPTFTLLQNFVRVPLRFNKDYPLVLYLAHRATVVGELKTLEATMSDIEHVENLIFHLPQKSKVLEDFKIAFENESPYIPYVFLCQETIVGMAILRFENEIEFIRSRYRIDDFICFDYLPIDSHAQIIHMIIMPIFSSFHRYFLQELMNISNKRVLYYRLYHKDASALTRTEPLVTFLGEMIPVLPRKELKYSLENYGDSKPDDFVLKKNIESNFALYMMIPRVASTQKIDVNVRVVVVGASDCGLSLLETLVFGPKSPYVSFTNITLISPHGIPFENRPDDLEYNEIYSGSRYSRDYRHLVGTRAWINVVQGTMTAINRKDKFVTISSMGNLSYDYLILTCGLQYQRPKFVKELKAEKKGEFCDYPNPVNCLMINNERDAANCLNYCKRIIAENISCSVVFYGQNIDCYSTIAMIVNNGLINPKNITLVEPALKMCETRDSSFDENDEIEETVIEAMKESGVNLLSGWNLIDWICEKDNDDIFIKVLILKNKEERRELECDVFFNFYKKTINLNAFLAICKSGLVFDGSLVIDPEFRTNDPFIFAAGTMTKYSRRYYADESSHKYYNPFEIGERFGNKLRNIIDPNNCDEDIYEIPKSKLDMTLPVFKKPVVTSCRLPGGYNYLNVRKPGKLTREDNNDVVLITGYPASAIGYFRIQLNQFDTVETITCLSKKEFETVNYVGLYGKHEMLLNNLKIRFQKSTIPDLYAYFREPWAVAIFFDRFDCLRVENRAILLSPTVVCGDSLANDCTKALIKSKWEAMNPEDRELIESRYAGSVYQEEIENCLIDFLQYFKSHLPMYCNPDFMRQFLHDVESIQDDPLFPRK